MARVSRIKFDAAGVLPLVTRLTLIVTLCALVLVTVNLSIRVLQLTAVYCVVWLLSACLAGISTLIETVRICPYC